MQLAFKKSAVALGAIGIISLGGIGTAFAANQPPHHEQADGCDHGATGKPCKPDPQPSHGKDCMTHGNHGGVNEDHCLGGTPSTTSSSPSTSQTSGSTSTTSSTSPTTLPTTSTSTSSETSSQSSTSSSTSSSPTKTVTQTSTTPVSSTSTASIPASPSKTSPTQSGTTSGTSKVLSTSTSSAKTSSSSTQSPSSTKELAFTGFNVLLNLLIAAVCFVIGFMFYRATHSTKR